MRWSADLPSLGRAAARRAFALRSLIDELQPPLDPEEKRRVAFATIEALNLWGAFARSYYLSCALRARDSGGVRVITRFHLARSEDAITFAVHWWKPKLKTKTGPWSPFDEPPWTAPSRLLDVLTAVGSSKTGDVAAAISASPQSFRDLKTSRNFFAHRSHGTVEEVRDVARGNLLSPALRPPELLATRLPGRPQNLLADWIDDLRFAIEAMAV